MNTTLRDEEKKRALLSRLARVEGQLRGVQKLIEEDADCEKIAQQLPAGVRQNTARHPGVVVDLGQAKQVQHRAGSPGARICCAKHHPV